MPMVQMDILEGRTLEQKRQVVKEVTEAICRSFNCSPDVVSIIIREMTKEHFAKGGQLRIDKS